MIHIKYGIGSLALRIFAWAYDVKMEHKDLLKNRLFSLLVAVELKCIPKQVN